MAPPIDTSIKCRRRMRSISVLAHAGMLYGRQAQAVVPGVLYSQGLSLVIATSQNAGTDGTTPTHRRSAAVVLNLARRT